MKRRSPTISQILSFLDEAKKHGYDAEVKSLKSKARPGIDIIRYPRSGSPSASGWFWEDIWVGSTPFSGTTTVWHKGKPCWQSHYWGYVIKRADAEFIYSFLRWARRQVWKLRGSSKVRGVGKFKGLMYEQKRGRITKEFGSFKKYERISKGGRTICEVHEIKGIVI